MRTVLTLSLCLAMIHTVGAQDDDYTLRLSDVMCDDEGVAEVAMTIDFEDGGDIQGYQWGVCHDSDDLTIEDDDDIVRGDAISSTTYTFEAIYTYDSADGVGWACGALLNVIVGEVIEPQDDAELYVITYMCEDTDSETSDLEFCETLGVPSITIRVIVDADEIEPVTENGVVTLVDPDQFLRGDVDNNGTVSALIDALYLLRWAFQSGDDPTCEDAADANDNGTLQAILDSLTLLQWAFQGGDEPPAPGPDTCGADETDDDDLECLEISDECA